MDIRKIDKNFDTTFTQPEDVEWFSARELPFSIHGIYFSEEEGQFRRLPRDVADATNDGVSHLSKHAAGGRVRFATDSPYITFRIKEPFTPPFSHMTILGKYGISLFANNRFIGTVMPSYSQLVKADPAYGGDGMLVFDGMKQTGAFGTEVYEANVILPLYSELSEVLIGLKKGCVLKAAKDYTYKKPVLFYGSSITQGGCATKPGDDYINRVSLKLDTDYINLGFSGSAKAEQVMADYIASIDASVYVLDYDHNAPSIEHLARTHFPLYETVRRAHPTAPIIVMTMPMPAGYENMKWYKERREIIINSFEKGRAQGDENLYLIDCYGCFGELYGGECGTMDVCHPDSLGFLRMAERVYPVLKEILEKNA